MGETITVAARLQALTVDLAQPILVGEGTARLLPEGSVSSLGSFLLEGLRTGRQIYAPPLVDAAPAPDEKHHPTRPRLVSGLRKT
jgi:adenylate cyclase